MEKLTQKITPYTGLRLIRIYSTLSQTKWAATIGIAKSHQSQLETGRREPSLRVLQSSANALQIPLSSLMFFLENYSNEGGEVNKPYIQDLAFAMLEWSWLHNKQYPETHHHTP